MEELPVDDNEHLMSLRIKLNSIEQATIISAYALTLFTEPEDKGIFYSTLERSITGTTQHKIILFGDFNARVSRNHLV